MKGTNVPVPAPTAYPPKKKRGTLPDSLAFQVYDVVEEHPDGIHPGRIAEILDVDMRVVKNKGTVMQANGLLVWEDQEGKWYPFRRVQV